MPASTSPITRGWPILTASMPNSRASSITTATAMKNAAKQAAGLALLLGGQLLLADREQRSCGRQPCPRSGPRPDLGALDLAGQLPVLVAARRRAPARRGAARTSEPEPSIAIAAPRQAERGLSLYSPAIESGGAGPRTRRRRVARRAPPGSRGRRSCPSTARSAASPRSSALSSSTQLTSPVRRPVLGPQAPAERCRRRSRCSRTRRTASGRRSRRGMGPARSRS